MPTKQKSAATIESLEAVTQWGRVIDGFQVTNKKLHAGIAAAFSLDPAEAETLLRLIRAPEEQMPMAKLARNAAFSSGGFTKIADRLTKRNFVQRNPSAEDRRVVNLGLTAQGREIAIELACLVADIVRSTYVDVLGPERAQLVADAMSDLRNANTA